MEAGHVWGGHEVFDRRGLPGAPSSPEILFNAARDAVTAPDLGDYDFHATMVGHVHAGTGYLGDAGTGASASGSLANLDLSLWRIVGGLFEREVAISGSLYGNSEFLRVRVEGGLYGVRVSYGGNIYDLTGAHAGEDYGLAWRTSPVPEPGAWGIAFAAVLVILIMRRRRQKLRLESAARSR